MEAKRRQLLKQTEADIAAAEAAIEALNNEIARPEVAADYKRMGEACVELDRLHARLDELYELYETLI